MRVVAALALLSVGAPIWLAFSLQLLWLRIRRPADLEDTRGEQQAQKEVQHPKVGGVSHEYVKAAGLQIHVARAGMSASKELVLFLHGWPEFWYSWAAQMQHLSSNFEVAAIDLPGMNASQAPVSRRGYLTGAICSVLAGVLNALGRDKCHLVGHDWGAAIAWDFAALCPARVHRLVAMAVPPPPLFRRNMDLAQMSASWYMNLFAAVPLAAAYLRRRDYAAIGALLSNPKMGGLRSRTLSDEAIAHFKDALARPGRLSNSLHYYSVMLIEDAIFGQNAEVRKASRTPWQMPVLMLAGDGDGALLPNCFKGIGKVAPNANTRILPKCSHWIQQDRPEEVNRLLMEFLSG